MVPTILDLCMQAEFEGEKFEKYGEWREAWSCMKIGDVRSVICLGALATVALSSWDLLCSCLPASCLSSSLPA